MSQPSVKRKLAKNQVSLGAWITIGHPAVAEIMAQSGFDWLAIDMEHAAITLAQAQTLIQVIELSGGTPLVRVGENDPRLIKQVLDAGAHGVIVPMVNTAAEASRAVDAVYYPPQGKRGVGLARAQKYGLGFEAYKKWLPREAILVAQIEHCAAVENLEDILAVKGIDATLIGPYDLSASMGYPGEFERPAVKAMIQQYIQTCRRLKKTAGFHSVPPDPLLAQRKIKEGFAFLGFSLDELFLAQSLKDALQKLHAADRK
ncbi:MAG: 2,4-dihydroxyhept-2-ene-1,7-dioic acid aldolase [Candidatus Omnitrophica bacterium]|nr:2,4-dihydroxyhept-2-ene-1,7-dioic acid aldolase [Candidatus Omnitrophota bacterium]